MDIFDQIETEMEEQSKVDETESSDDESPDYDDLDKEEEE